MENKTIKYITILDETSVKLEDGKKYNLCQCKCGNIKYILTATLKSERIRDCGCGKYMLDRMVGIKNGKLTVIEAYRERKGKNQKVNIICKCRCECGNIVNIPASKVKNQISCGCISLFNFDKYKNKYYNGIQILELVDKDRKIVSCRCKCGNIFTCELCDLTSTKNPIIGCSECPEFVRYTKNTKYIHKSKLEPNRLRRIYSGMKSRCNNPKDKDYKLYGKRNIYLCDEWLGEKGFLNFEKWAISNGYNDKLTIDRIDSNKGYSPDNCRWVDFTIQANNRRNNVKYLFNGEYLTMPQIARVVGINTRTLASRLRRGLTIEDATITPVKRRNIKNG